MLKTVEMITDFRGTPPGALGMVTLEVPKVSQVRRISNQGVLREQSRNQQDKQRQDNRMDKRDTIQKVKTCKQ